MKRKTISILFILLFVLAIPVIAKSPKGKDAPLKPRIVVLTDIAPANIEPDDMESMIRLLAHADLYEIEALIATGGWNSSNRPYPTEWLDSLKTCIDAYEKDLPNLMKRSNQSDFLSLEVENQQQAIGYWPSAAYLHDRTMLGSLELGYEKLGNENNSAGSDLLSDWSMKKIHVHSGYWPGEEPIPWRKPSGKSSRSAAKPNGEIFYRKSTSIPLPIKMSPLTNAKITVSVHITGYVKPVAQIFTLSGTKALGYHKMA